MAGILTISHLRHSPNCTSRSPGRKAKCEVPASAISLKNGISDNLRILVALRKAVL